MKYNKINKKDKEKNNKLVPKRPGKKNNNNTATPSGKKIHLRDHTF